MTQRTGPLQAIRRFLRDRHGISAVEFALVMPIMVTLFLGGTELTQAITIKRKTTIATRAVADLVSQDTSITSAEMTAIFGATTAVIAPFPAGNFYVVVSSVGIDKDGKAEILWSEANTGDSPHKKGDIVSLPEGLDQFPETSLIWAEATYSYTPQIGYYITGTMELKDKLYLRPRLVKYVQRD